MKNQKGITLIALIITIIVMLILVAVSVTIALESGLFNAAQSAAKNTNQEATNELKLSEGKVTVDGVTYDSMQEYINTLKGGSGSETEDEEETEEPNLEELVDPDGDGITTFTLQGDTYDVTAGTTWGEFFTARNEAKIEECNGVGCGEEGCAWKILAEPYDNGYIVVGFSSVAWAEYSCECGKYEATYSEMLMNLDSEYYGRWGDPITQEGWSFVP